MSTASLWNIVKFSDYIKVALRRQRGLSVLKSMDEYCLPDKPVSIGKGCSPSRVASEACLPISEHNACLKMESSSQAIESTQVQYNPCRPTWLLDLSHITVSGPCHMYNVQLMQAQWTKGGIANLRNWSSTDTSATMNYWQLMINKKHDTVNNIITTICKQYCSWEKLVN